MLIANLRSLLRRTRSCGQVGHSRPSDAGSRLPGAAAVAPETEKLGDKSAIQSALTR
jgi:hypothetical protein